MEMKAVDLIAICIFDQHRFHAQTEYDLRHWG